mgnify:CR=1 FL=1
MSRSRVKSEWAEMLTRGIVPVMDVDDPRGQVVVNVQLCDKGVWFNWDWDWDLEVEIDRPRFAGGWLISFAEIDRMGYRLDAVLHLIHDNVIDGLFHA